MSISGHNFDSNNSSSINKVEPNNSLDTAQNIDDNFTIGANSNIQSSDTAPYVSIAAEGDGTFDYYSFQANQGDVGVFDIDDSIPINTNIDNINLRAGTINLTATQGNINLNNSTISTSTVGRGDAGNINITTPKSLFLSGGSNLLTQATNNAKGGNIRINSNFVVAIPNQDNDIIARASGGAGGNITINAIDILGLEVRNSTNNNNTNDIDNRSEIDPELNGILEINTTNVDIRSQITKSPGKYYSARTLKSSMFD